MLEYINQLKDVVVGKIMISLGEGIRWQTLIEEGREVRVKYNGDFSNTPEGLKNRACWDEDEIREEYEETMEFEVGGIYKLRGVVIYNIEGKKMKSWVVINPDGERFEGEHVQLFVDTGGKTPVVAHSFLFDAA
jgi:hypothetical protein